MSTFHDSSYHVIERERERGIDRWIYIYILFIMSTAHDSSSHVIERERER